MVQLLPRRALATTIFALAIASSAPILAAGLMLDASFGTNGVVEASFAGKGGGVSAVVTRPDGSLLAIGSYAAGYSAGPFGQPFPYSFGVVAGYTPNGSADLAFGNDGLLDLGKAGTYPSFMQRDGKQVGATNTGLIRYNADGSLDTAFKTDGAAGIAWYNGVSYLAQQADGRIVACSTVGPGIGVVVLLRFNSDGSLDSSFNYVGAAIAPLGNSTGDTCGGLVVTADGKIVVAATANGPNYAQAIALMRYNADGSIDASFGNGGRAALPFTANHRDVASLLRWQAPGRLIVAGTSLTAFLPNGSLDGSFGSGGVATLDAFPDDLNVETDGSLIAATRSDEGKPSRLLSFTRDGQPGPALAPILPSVTSISLQANGDVVIAGSSGAGNFAIARYASGPVAVAEFYNAALDHYFLTLNPQEAADLDLGVHAGWSRTGQSFLAYGNVASAPAGMQPVCRFYIPPQRGNSHFFSVDTAECDAVAIKAQTDPNYSGYAYETADAFYAALPDRATGACPATTIPVYRLWNHRADSNHRYTTSQTIKEQMTAKGFVPEGYGPDAVAMCTPQQPSM